MVCDLRNHGWNRVGSRISHNLPTLVYDHEVILESILRTFGTKPTVGVFHSHTALVALISSSAILRYAGPRSRKRSAERLAAMTRRRGWRFASEATQEVCSSSRPPMSAPCPEWQDSEFRCPREYEAQISGYVRSVAPLLDLDSLSCPTKVIGADPTLPYSYPPTMDLTSLMAVDCDVVPESTQYLQLERPEECVAITGDYLGVTGLLMHGARGTEPEGAGPT